MVEISVRDLISPELLKRADGGLRKRALRAGAVVLARATQLAWREPGRRPKEWAPLAASTVRAKGHDEILVGVPPGHLKDSFVVGEVTDAAATVGTDVGYALYLQMGTKRMPARPFVPVTEEGRLTDQAAREIKEAMEGVLKRG